VLLNAPLVRAWVLRWLGRDVASIERVSQFVSHPRDVLYAEVVAPGGYAARGT
jgi:hypothetical protein